MNIDYLALFPHHFMDAVARHLDVIVPLGGAQIFEKDRRRLDFADDRSCARRHDHVLAFMQIHGIENGLAMFHVHDFGS